MFSNEQEHTVLPTFSIPTRWRSRSSLTGHRSSSSARPSCTDSRSASRSSWGLWRDSQGRFLLPPAPSCCGRWSPRCAALEPRTPTCLSFYLSPPPPFPPMRNMAWCYSPLLKVVSNSLRKINTDVEVEFIFSAKCAMLAVKSLLTPHKVLSSHTTLHVKKYTELIIRQHSNSSLYWLFMTSPPLESLMNGLLHQRQQFRDGVNLPVGQKWVCLPLS